MGTVCRKAVWGAALLLWLVPAAGHASSGKGSGKHGARIDSGSARGQRTVIVTLKPGRKDAVRNKLQRRGRNVYGDHTLVEALSVRVDDEGYSDLANDPDVESIAYDAPVTASSDWSWSDWSSFWDLPRPTDYGYITPRAFLGLDGSVTGAGIGVAIIDSGISPSIDFFGRISAFQDFTNNRNGRPMSPYDDFGHGTHVAGLIGSSGALSERRYVGVAPGVKFVGLKVLDSRGVGRTSDVIAALEFAVANRERYNIRIVNLSLGHPVYEPAAQDPLVKAVEAAVRAGLVVVVSAGNCGVNPQTGIPGYAGVTSPGNAPSAITVGAADTAGTVGRSDDRVEAYSSRGPSWYDGIAKPDVVAPGHQLISNQMAGSTLASALSSDMLRDGYGRFLPLSGSSMSAAVVSGLVAVMLEANAGAISGNRPAFTSQLSPNAIKMMLQYTATPLRDDSGALYDALTQGTGLVNGAGAVAVASRTDTRKAVDALWSTAPLSPWTSFDGVSEAWSQAIVWGTRVVQGSGLVEIRQSEWAENIVWGTGELDNVLWGAAWNNGEIIVWGTALGSIEASWWGNAGFGENIVWGTLGWAENIVWGTGLLGSYNGENIVWGTLLGENIVWGTLLDENIVWGTLFDENIVWGTSYDGSSSGKGSNGGAW